MVWIVLAVLAVALVVVGVVLARRQRTTSLAPRSSIDYAPGVGDDDSIPRDTPRQAIDEIVVSDALTVVPEPLTQTQAPDQEVAILGFEIPDPAVGRMHRLRARLARSNNAIGKGLLGLLGRDNLDAGTWDEIEETLLAADLGVTPTRELMEKLRTAVQVEGHPTQERLIELLRSSLLELVNPNLDRSLNTKIEGRPAVVLVVGVNGTGKTTTTGKLARLLIADDQTVLLGAADTFRAAAAEQLQTWGDRVGAPVVRGPEGGDPAAVAFDAVSTAMAAELDTAVIDTAGRLHTKTGLMDELGKVKRVIEKQSPVDEVLLVLDATTGQNGLVQARVFAEVVDVTGVVLTKLDGTARGGIVIAVQRELGVPVKLVGLGEGPDDLAPFDAVEFVEAIIHG
ncbi:MAG: signal recognition particle-docking protein FtsY [Actinobacteria bacterium]|nr:signal recognition particle-docking protein FtsY [Actinomycetota bacterium]MSZ40670.1 signal recognition particle-docking protein FtsY [Actinomycetota bacterium]